MSTICSLLLLFLMLHISEEQQVFVVRSGDMVTLPCGNVSLNHCTWNVNELVLKYKVRSRRTSIHTPMEVLTRIYRKIPNGSCELQFQQVTELNAGVYTCTELNQSQFSTTEYFLSVVTFSDPGLMSSQGLTCDVMPHNGPENCGHLVKWLVQGSDHNQLRFTTSQCSAKVYSMSPSSPNLSCEVTDLNHNQVYVFAAQGNQTRVQTENEPEESQDPHPVVTVLMLLMRSVELLMVSVITVILLRVYSCCSSVNYHQDSKRTRKVHKNRSLKGWSESTL